MAIPLVVAMPTYRALIMSENRLLDTLSSASVLGIRIDRLSQQQVLDRIDALVAEWRASKHTLPCKQVITVNPEFVMAAQQNMPFRQCINEATLVTPDGIGIVWAMHYLHTPTPERVTGTDTLIALTKRCADKGYRLYLLGAAPGVAEEAAQHLQEMAPSLQIAGCYAGSPALAEEEAILARIAAAQADIVCVAYGAPAQDLWIYRNKARLPAAVAIGVGGAYDFISGRQLRAPENIRRLGLEWLFRLYREPWRWRRMLALPHFVIEVLLKGKGRSAA